MSNEIVKEQFDKMIKLHELTIEKMELLQKQINILQAQYSEQLSINHDLMDILSSMDTQSMKMEILKKNTVLYSHWVCSHLEKVMFEKLEIIDRKYKLHEHGVDFATQPDSEFDSEFFLEPSVTHLNEKEYLQLGLDLNEPEKYLKEIENLVPEYDYGHTEFPDCTLGDILTHAQFTDEQYKDALVLLGYK